MFRYLAAAAAWVALGVVGAAAADKPLYQAPAAWVDVAPIPPARDGDGLPAVQTLLDDNQSRLTPEGQSYYVRRVSRIVKPEGLSAWGSRSLSWDPDTETVFIHTLSILRAGKTIDLLAGGKDVLVLRRETNLERAMLDGRLTATKQLEGLQVGDVVDWSFTRTRDDPVVKGHVENNERLAHAGVAGRFRARVFWPDAVPVRWRNTMGMPVPKVGKVAGGSELLLDLTDVTAPQPPTGAPPRFRDLGGLEMTSYRDWAEVSALMASLYAKAGALEGASALKAEAAAIAAASRDPKARAQAALTLVQEKVRYFYLGMDSGGYVPAKADETWTRRFGDCKGKTALLLALLRELKIEAEPVLVSTTNGDGLNERLPSLRRFDHVLVKATVGGRDYWLDGTRRGDRAGLDALEVPRFRWGLPIRAAGAALIPIEQKALTTPLMGVVLRIDASKGLDAPAPARVELSLAGDMGRMLSEMAAAQSKEAFDRMSRESFAKGFSWIEVKETSWSQEPGGVMRLVFTGDAEMDWVENTDVGAREFRAPAGQDGTAKYPKREPGPNADAPFAVEHPTYVTSLVEVVLPDQGRGFVVKGPRLSETVAGLEIVRKAELVDGVARFQGSARSVAPEISAAEAQAANRAFRRLAAEPDVIRAPVSKTASLR